MRGHGLVVFLLLGVGVVWAQEPAFERLDSRDGVPHNTVHALLQDRRGFLWVGTADGLARFDGRRFEVFRRRPGTPGTLPSNTVQAIAEAADGALWVGTAAGACRLDGEATRRFTCPEPRLDVLHLLADDETVWVTTSGGVWRLGADGTFEQEMAAETLRASAWQFAVRNGRFVAASGELEGRTVHRHRHDRGGFVRAGRERLPDHTVGLLTADGGVVSFPEADVPGLGVTGWGAFGGMHTVRAGETLWLGAEAGLFQADRGRLKGVDLARGSALGASVLALAATREGTLWVGTRDGLFVRDPAWARFQHRGAAETGASGPVMAVTTDAAGRLWMGTLGDGLIRVEPSGAQPVGRLDGGDRWVWALRPASGGGLWVGTDGGLCRLGPEAGAAPTCLRVPLERADGAAHVYALADDGAGGVWAGGTTLVRLDDFGAVVQRVDLEPAFDASAVTVLRHDRRGRLWVGGEKRGLWRLDRGALVRVPLGDLDRTSVWSVHEAADGALWLGTADGLVRLEADGGATAHAAGLPASTVYGVAGVGPDLWLTTPRGVARYRPSTGALVVYGPDDGLRTVEFNRRAVHRAPDGRLHLGGTDGLTSLEPEAFDRSAPPPATFVTAVRAASAAGEVMHDASGPLRLGPEVRAVAVEVAAPSPSGGRGLRYAYRLDPLDEGWVEVDGPVVRLAGVPPGRYTFRARASRGDGVWGEAAVLPLALLPPWYGTFWFRALALGAALVLVVGAVRWRIRGIRREERMRWRIASDLHDDIGSGLASVALLTERVRDRAPLPEAEARQLALVARAARSMVESLREIVWFVDPSHDRPGAFAARARETATALLGPRATVEAPARLRLDAAPLSIRRDVFLVLKEALHNAACHAPEAAVRVTITEAAGDLVLTVADDGPGFEPASGSEGTGLRSLRRRAEALGGCLDVASAPGTGTTVTLRAPIP